MIENREQIFLSLGAGENQTPLIISAKKAGYLVIGVDQNIEAIGFQHCDYIIQESITNYENIILKLKTELFIDRLAGAYSASFGNALITLGAIVDTYSLRGLKKYQYINLIDKDYVRSVIKQSNHSNIVFQQPVFYAFENIITKNKLSAMKYPVILKTRRGHGKINIFEISSFTDLQKAINRSTLEKGNLKRKELIVEEKIKGDEITVTGFVQNNQFHLVVITDKITTENAPFIELEHRYPSNYEKFTEQIIQAHNDLITILQINNTPLVSEWKIHNNELYLIEISPQLPGEYLATILIPEVTGYDLFKNTVSLATGLPLESITNKKNHKKGFVQFFTAPVKEYEWSQYKKKAIFSKILRTDAPKVLRSNHDRHAVIVIVD